jgi:putative ABC transport system permease protein
MIINYLQVTWRSLLRRKLYTLLNVLGLTFAIASSVIIFLYARSELSYDAFHTNAERIHLVYKERQAATGVQELDDTWMPLLQVMQERFPAIEDGVRTFVRDGLWVELDDNRKFRETVTYADPGLLTVFSFPLAFGDVQTALDGRNTMVLSRATAERYFGAQNPLGRRVTLNFNEDYVVTGVFDDVPQNSTLRPDIVIPAESRFLTEDLVEASGDWDRSFLQTWLLLAPGATPAALEAQLPALVSTLFDPAGPNGAQNMQLKLWPLRSLHDRSENANTAAYVLLAIALSIIVVAAINFMNLSIARALERVREVGVRKTLGSPRTQLLLLFFLEPLVISLAALLLAVELASLLLPIFNSLYGLELALNPGADPVLLTMLAAIGVASALLSGCYPALVLSGFRSVDALKGSHSASPQGIRLRNGLTFMQFALAIVLVTGIGAVWMQIRFMQNQALNFTPDNVVVIPVNSGDFADSELAAGRLEVFKDEIRRIAGVASVASSTSVPGDYQDNNVFAQPEGWTGDEPLRMLIAPTDENYFDTYDMQFVEGENFSAANDGNTGFIINETAKRAIGWDLAVGKQLNGGIVVGVVQDFHYGAPGNGIRPILHRYAPPEERADHNFISVKLDAVEPQAVLAAIEAMWTELDPTRGFAYYFVDDSIDALYSDINNTGRILGYFALLSIVIANLGLLGLSSYAVVQRTKEIGIRKVFGSTVPQVAVLLSSQFLKPVLLANLVAWPVAWFAIARWLEGFAYHADINWLMFPFGGICILLLALLTVALQSVKAASVNLVAALRYE